MAQYNPEHLRYLPQQDPFNKHLDAPGNAYAEHMKDVEAQRQAREAMALRQQQQEHNIENDDITNRPHAIGMQRDEAHTNRRDSAYEREVASRESQVAFDRARLKHADIEKWANLMAYGKTPEEKEYAASMLQALHGKKTRQLFDEVQPEAPVGAPEEAPVEVRDPTLGGTIDPMDGRAMGHVKPPTAADAKLSSQLDGIDQTYSKGLGAKPGFIPGRPATPAVPRAEVAKSNAMLDPADPYNQLVGSSTYPKQ